MNWLTPTKRWYIRTLREFMAHFGVSPSVVDFIWKNHLKGSCDHLQPYHFLWWLYFIKTASSLDCCAVFWRVSRVTILKWRRIISELLDTLDYVKWDYRYINHNIRSPCCSIDTTACPIDRPSLTIQHKYFSVKHQCHCLKYEIAVNMDDGICVWVNGPYKGAEHDLAIAREKIVFHLDFDETITGDKAYVGDNHFLTPFKPANTLQKNLFNRTLARKHVKIENYSI